MTSRSMARLAPLSGVAFVALLAAGAIIIGTFDYLPSGDTLVAFFTDNSGRILLGAYVAMLGAFFFLVFVGTVTRRMRRELGDSVLPDVALVAGAAGAALIAGGYAVLAVAADRAGSAGGIPAATVIGLHDLYGTLVGDAAPIVLAAFVGAAGLAGMAGSLMPRWLAIVSVLVAIGMASPVAYIFIALLLIWAPLVGIVMVGSRQPAAA